MDSMKGPANSSCKRRSDRAWRVTTNRDRGLFFGVVTHDSSAGYRRLFALRPTGFLNWFLGRIFRKLKRRRSKDRACSCRRRCATTIIEKHVLMSTFDMSTFHSFEVL